MRVKKIFAILVVLLIATVLLATPAPAQKTIKWKLQTLWSAGVTPYKCLQDFCERVKVMTNGRLEITPYPAGAIVPTFDTLEAVRNNILQAINVWPGYFAGKDPAFALLSDFIMAYRAPWEYEAFYYEKGGQKLLNELYKPYNVVSIGVVLWGIESMPTKFPCRRPEDFKGHKFRSPQGLTADLLTKLGCGVVILPGQEVYSALDKGVIDGTDWATPSVNHKLGFDRVAKYFIYPGFRSMPISDLAVNKKAWDKLSPDMQEILKVAVRQWNADQLVRVHIDDIHAVAEMEANGCTAIAWKEQDINRMRDMVYDIWMEWAKKSPMSKKAVDAHLSWLKELGRVQ